MAKKNNKKNDPTPKASDGEILLEETSSNEVLLEETSISDAIQSKGEVLLEEDSDNKSDATLGEGKTTEKQQDKKGWKTDTTQSEKNQVSGNDNKNTKQKKENRNDTPQSDKTDKTQDSDKRDEQNYNKEIDALKPETIWVYNQNGSGIFKFICFIGFLIVCYFCYFAFTVNIFDDTNRFMYLAKIGAAAILYIVLACKLPGRVDSRIADETKLFDSLKDNYKIYFTRQNQRIQQAKLKQKNLNMSNVPKSLKNQIQDVERQLQSLNTVDKVELDKSRRDYQSQVRIDKFFKLFYYALLGGSIYLIYWLL